MGVRGVAGDAHGTWTPEQNPNELRLAARAGLAEDAAELAMRSIPGNAKDGDRLPHGLAAEEKKRKARLGGGETVEVVDELCGAHE